MTKQLGLSREIQQDAQEMVRRAEYALGKAIRAGQERGEIRTSGQRGSSQVSYERVRNGRHESVQEARRDHDSSLTSPYDFAPKSELAGATGGDGIYALVDGVSDCEFDAALTDAKAEGNLSRANVARKIQGVNTFHDQRCRQDPESVPASGPPTSQEESQVEAWPGRIHRLPREFL